MDRTELFERVWSQPVSQLAAEWGLSGPGLRKACVRPRFPCHRGGSGPNRRPASGCGVPGCPPCAKGWKKTSSWHHSEHRLADVYGSNCRHLRFSCRTLVTAPTGSPPTRSSPGVGEPHPVNSAA